MKKKGFRKLIILLLWILLWEIAALIVHNEIYFAGPVKTLRELAGMIREGRFWRSVGASLLRIYLGLLIAFVSAWISATLAWRVPIVEEILSPFISFLRSVPVAAVVVILLIWFGAPHLVLYISFMVIYPNLYGNILSGYRHTDPQLIEMADLFRVSAWQKFRFLYRPSYLPYLATAMPFCIGMGYKSGVAAEVIGLPDPSIGERIYSAKIYLNTAGVFAWIVVILLLNLPAEKLVSVLLKKAGVPKLRKKAAGSEQRGTHSREISLKDIKKGYDGREVLNIEEAHFNAGGIYCIMGESGAGKTTLLKILAGTIKPDSGKAVICDGEENDIPADIAMCFQENRLLPGADVLTNLYFAGCTQECEEKLSGLLPKELHEKKTEQLSGGEQRRVALARAVLSEGDLLLLDEPFTGLDEENRMRAAAWILENRRGRTMILVTHDRDDVGLLQAECMLLNDGRLSLL